MTGNHHHRHHCSHHQMPGRSATRCSMLSPFNVLALILIVQLCLCLFYLAEMRRCDAGITRETFLNVHIPWPNNLDKSQYQKHDIDSERFPIDHVKINRAKFRDGDLGGELMGDDVNNSVNEMFQEWSMSKVEIDDKLNLLNLSKDESHVDVNIPTEAVGDRISRDLQIIEAPLSDSVNILELKKTPVTDFKQKKLLTKGSLGNILIKLSGRLKGKVPQMLPNPGEVAHDNRRNFTIVTSTNAAFLDFTENWLLSLKRIGIKHNISIIAEDKVAYDFLSRKYRNEHIHVYTTTNDFSPAKALQFLSAEYRNLVNRRAAYILHFLRNGLDVLAADVDAYWFRDPIDIIHGTYDVYDVWTALGADEKRPCPCLMYLKSKPNVMEMVQDWSLRLQRLDGKENDQEGLGQILWKYKVQKGTRVTSSRLDQDLFPTGDVFFSPSWWWEHGKRVYVIHANRIGNHDKKVALFREYNLWLIEPYNVDLSNSTETN